MKLLSAITVLVPEINNAPPREPGLFTTVSEVKVELLILRLLPVTIIAPPWEVPPVLVPVLLVKLTLSTIPLLPSQ